MSGKESRRCWVVFCFGAGLVLAAAFYSWSKEAPSVDVAEYDSLMAGHASDIYDLEALFFGLQDSFLPIVPPDPSFLLRQQCDPALIPFSWKNFPSDFVRALVSEYENSVPVYPITIYEDPYTRATVFCNSDGKSIFSLPSVPGYDPYVFLKTVFPDIYSGRFSSGAIEFLQTLYDPARVQMSAKLIPAEYVEQYLYVAARLADVTSLSAEASGDTGMFLRSEEAETEIVFESIKRTNVGNRIIIGYPDEFSDRLDIFTCNEPMQYIWTFAAKGLSTTGANEILWYDTNYWVFSGPFLRFYSAGNADLDTDGDGYSDASERMVYITNPADSNSRPVHASGTVTYNGVETGTIYALTVTSSSSWSIALSTSMSVPGSYTNDVAKNQSYWFKAFRDINTNYTRDDWEPQGLYSVNSTTITNDTSGLNITMQDQPSIWGTVNYSGSETGDIWVVAVPTSNSWDTTYHYVIPWIQSYTTTSGGEVYVSFPVAYSITGLPASNCWIRAFIDSDANEAFTHLEAAGQYTSNSIPVSNRVTGISFTLAQDADSDGMPDWWEWQYGFNPQSTNDAGQDADSDALNNLGEYTWGTDPRVQDTDGDGMKDGDEVAQGYDPAISNAAAQVWIRFPTDGRRLP